MARIIAQAEQTQRLEAAIHSRKVAMAKDAGLVVGASVLMAISAHISIPLFFSPVPVTMQPLAMLLIAFLLDRAAPQLRWFSTSAKVWQVCLSSARLVPAG